MVPTISFARLGVLALLAFTPHSTVGAQRSRACWLVTPAEAAQILGRPELASGEDMHDDYARCSYSRGGFDVHLNHGRTVANIRQALDDDIKSGKIEAISGLGDHAGIEKAGKQPTLIVIKGTHVLETRILSSGWHGSPDQLKPTIVKLAQTALAKLSAGGNAPASRRAGSSRRPR